jgi:hypothetical protein
MKRRKEYYKGEGGGFPQVRAVVSLVSSNLPVTRPNTKSVATLLLEGCEDETHTPEMGTWESIRTPKTSEFDCRGQNTSH